MPYFYPYNTPYTPPAQPAQMTPGIPGRIVNSFQEITIGDIPTNGTVAFFVKSDFTEIQTRKWSDDGRVLVASYKPENALPVNLPSTTEKPQESVPALSTADVIQRLDDINARLDQIITKPTQKAKKENEDI